MPRMRRHTVRSSRSSVVIGIDLGGTNMQIGAVDARNRIIGRDRRKTQARDGCDRVIERIVEGIHAACGDANQPELTSASW